jgi:adenylate cyclase
MGRAIEEAGGHLDKFIGDGVMAIFGIDKPLKTGAQEAIMAAKRMSERLEQLNAALLHDIKEPLKIGIGIHSGKAIVGNMGYNKAISLTAIGDVVNTASRLESLNKDLNTQMIVSSKTVQISELDFSDYTAKKVSIRGRADELDVYATVDASKLEVQLKTKLVV